MKFVQLHFTIFSQLNTYSELLGSLILIVFFLVRSNSSADANFRCENLSHSHFLGLNNEVEKLDQNFLWGSLQI